MQERLDLLKVIKSNSDRNLLKYIQFKKNNKKKKLKMLSRLLSQVRVQQSIVQTRLTFSVDKWTVVNAFNSGDTKTVASSFGLFCAC